MAVKRDKRKILETAERYVRAGRFQEAIGEYEKLLEVDPEEISALNTIGDLYIRIGQEKKAIMAFEKVAASYESKSLYSQALAIYKKINKLNPEEADFTIRLANVYNILGFSLEAKAEYQKAAELLKKQKRQGELIELYEKLVSLDSGDLKTRLLLAENYAIEGRIEEAVNNYNEVAEAKIWNNELEEAKGILEKAKALRETNPRTITNIAEVLKKENKIEEAIKLVEVALESDKDSVELLRLAGSLYYETRNYEQAEAAFLRIFSLDPMDADVRAKLGRIKIYQDDLDQAYYYFEPVVSNLIRKGKEAKAIGLLGLIISGPRLHLPALEKLASIYKAKNDTQNLGIVYRVMLQECQRREIKDQSLFLLKELLEIYPDNRELREEYRELRMELGLGEEKGSDYASAELTERDRELIRRTLVKADLYLEQGLIKLARRLLENLRLQFDEDPKIIQKLALIENIEAQVEIDEEEIPLLVKKASAKESLLERREPTPKGVSIFDLTREFGPDEEKVTAADIFSDTEIIPVPDRELGELKYYDLSQKISEELNIIESIINQQGRGKRAVWEKELSEIVSEFRKKVEKKVDKKSYEIRYNLGLAFLEQGLIDEAIEEMKIASADPNRTLECCSIISDCYKRKRDYPEAMNWIVRSLELVKPNSHPYYALKYEMALLYEEIKEEAKALDIYQEILNWDEDFRDVREKVRAIEKKFSEINV